MPDEPTPGGAEVPSDQPWSEQIRHSQVGARVPAHVARGVFSTGAIVLEGAHEFVIDFLLRMAKPQQVVARVVMVPDVLRRFVGALQQNLKLYESHFGNQRLRPLNPQGTSAAAVPQSPQPLPGQSGPILAAAGQPADGEDNETQAPAASAESAPAQPPGGASVSELYEQLKLPDEALSGSYANAVMIGHTPSEFSFDFITTFFPRSAVCCRVFMSAGTVPVFLNSLQHAYEQHARKQQPPPPA